jgi:hypothetical protein
MVGQFWGRVSMACFSALKKCVNDYVEGLYIAITWIGCWLWLLKVVAIISKPK